MNSRTGTSKGTLTSVRPGKPGKGREIVMTPPSTASFVVVVTAVELDGLGRDEKVRPTRTSPRAGDPFSLSKLPFRGIAVVRLMSGGHSRRAAEYCCCCCCCCSCSWTMFEVPFQPLVLWSNRRIPTVERLATAALEQTAILEHISVAQPLHERRTGSVGEHCCATRLTGKLGI